jgi:hypothetical protein
MTKLKMMVALVAMLTVMVVGAAPAFAQESADADEQLENVDLQDELQGQQPLLQIMSNISKMDYGKAMAELRKMGY